MLRYILKRLAMTLVVVVLVMTFLAALVHLLPGDPVRTILGPRASGTLVERVRAEMGLDDPILVQVGSFIANAFRGDLGLDFVSRTPVTGLLGDAIVHTVILALSSLALAVTIGVPLGVYAATRPNTLADRIVGVASVSLITMPAYVAGLFLLLVFAVNLRVLPATGVGDLGDPVDYLRHLILPATALAITWIGYLARLVRASMLEVLSSNYIRVAHAFGVGSTTVFYRLALKNALVPTVAVLGVGLGNLMGGAVFVEVIFARSGLGTLIYDAILTRNYPIVRGGVLVVALLFVFANFITDLSYRFLDPRIRVEEARH